VGNIEELGLRESTISAEPVNDESSDVIDALAVLGFSQFEAKKVLDNMDLKGKSENDIIKEALKNMSR